MYDCDVLRACMAVRGGHVSPQDALMNITMEISPNPHQGSVMPREPSQPGGGRLLITVFGSQWKGQNYGKGDG